MLRARGWGGSVNRQRFWRGSAFVGLEREWGRVDIRTCRMASQESWGGPRPHSTAVRIGDRRPGTRRLFQSDFRQRGAALFGAVQVSLVSPLIQAAGAARLMCVSVVMVSRRGLGWDLTAGRN